jgi:PAS domain S-box-containing protein
MGIYPDSIAADVTPARLRRFFKRVDRGYQIAGAIRDNIVFARQDLTRDPPFSKLDLVSCRNVLIYLGSVLQKKAVSVFHYALKPSGMLLMGSSETLGGYTHMFSVLDKRYRIFVKRPGPSRAELDLPFEHAVAALPGTSKTQAPVHPEQDLQREVDRILLAHYAPAGVVVNEAGRILQFRGQTGRYLEPAPGEPNLNLMKMAREGLGPDLLTALHAAGRSGGAERRNGVRVRSNGGVLTVDLEVRPLRSPLAKEQNYLVLFHEAGRPAPETGTPQPAPRESLKKPAGKPDFDRLNEELGSTKRYLQSIIEEQEATNEELKSANEEVQSSNEELQSTNEELETAKEELQSSNEELITLNEELQNRNLELAHLNNDLSNLLTSISVPIVMLSSDLRIRRFTPAAEKILNLIPGDVGRPITDIKSSVEVPDLENLLTDVIQSLASVEREVQDRAGRWYSLWMRPYRTADNKIDGAVMGFADIDALKRGLKAAEDARTYAEAIVETVREPLAVLDSQLRVRSANRSFYHTFRISSTEAEGKTLWDLSGGHWDLPAVRALIQETRPGQARFQDVEVEQDFDVIGRRRFVLNARVIPAEGAERLILLAMEDITDRRAATEIRYRRLFESAPDAIVMVDVETGRITDINPYTEQWLGYPRPDVVGKRFSEAGGLDDPQRAEAAYLELLQSAALRRDEVLLRTRKGEAVYAEVIGSLYMEGGRRVIQFNLRDISERKRHQDQVRNALREKEVLLQEIHHRVKNNLQLVVSLLNLQAGYGHDGDPGIAFTEMRDRVLSMASVHDLLYASGELARIDLAAYIRKLVGHLSQSYGRTAGTVDFAIQVDENLALDLERAVPCGLIINELVSNALKHAFGDKAKKLVSIQLIAAADQRCSLRVVDNGKGIPKEVNYRSPKSLGLKLVNILAEQLNGTLTLVHSKEGGADFRLRFPIRTP